MVIRHGDRSRVEGVGLDDVCTGIEILLMDLTDDLRLGQRQQVVVAFDIVGKVLESLAAIGRLVQFVVLDHRTHRAVENQDAAFEQFRQLLGAGSHGFVMAPGRHGRCKESANFIMDLRDDRQPPIMLSLL